MTVSRLCLLAIGIWASAVSPSFGLEFVAEQITRTDGHVRKANIYYRDDMWRIEHNDHGPVTVTIVRRDRHLMWCLLARIKQFKTLPYDPIATLRINATLEGEVSREAIGSEILEGHPTVLYEVTTNEGQREVIYYQWLAGDIRFPLRLARKDGSWVIEYRNVRLRPVSSYHFQLPLNYLPMDEPSVER